MRLKRELEELEAYAGECAERVAYWENFQTYLPKWYARTRAYAARRCVAYRAALNETRARIARVLHVLNTEDALLRNEMSVMADQLQVQYATGASRGVIARQTSGMRELQRMMDDKAGE